jgi:hypothetical protein
MLGTQKPFKFKTLWQEVDKEKNNKVGRDELQQWLQENAHWQLPMEMLGLVFGEREISKDQFI